MVRVTEDNKIGGYDKYPKKNDKEELELAEKSDRKRNRLSRIIDWIISLVTTPWL